MKNSSLTMGGPGDEISSIDVDQANKPRSMEDILKLMTTAEGAPEVVTAADVELLANLPVEFKHMQPYGLLVQCMSPTSMTPLDIPSETMRRLILQFGIVVLRGFEDVKCEGDNLVAVADKLGEIVYWTNFGAVLDVKEVPHAGGSVMSSQALGFHWDGCFKFHNSQLQEIPYADVPSFVLFKCVQAPQLGGRTGGETLMTDTRRVLRSKINATKREKLDLASLEAEYFAPNNVYFGGRWVQHTFVSPHPITGEPRLRYMEPWPESKSAKQWTAVRAVRESDAPMVAEAIELLNEMIYDELFCHKHTWVAKDFVFLDNHSILHARTACTEGSERHIRRVHFN